MTHFTDRMCPSCRTDMPPSVIEDEDFGTFLSCPCCTYTEAVREPLGPRKTTLPAKLAKLVVVVLSWVLLYFVLWAIFRLF